MRIESIELTRFGLHRDLRHSWAAGTNGIIGDNGRGKSTVLAALEYAVTGTIPTAGAKEANIAQLHGAGVSKVMARLTHGPHTLEVTRGLRKAKTELVIDGGEAILGDKAVNAELAQVFGPAYGLFGEYVFVKQGRIDAFLEATEADRAKVFAQLFGTRKAEEVWSLLGKRLAQVQVPQRSGEMDVVRRRLGDNRETHQSLKAQLAEYDDVKDYDPAADPDRGTVERRRAWAEAKAEQVRAQAVVDQLVDRVRLARKATQAVAARYDELARAADAGAEGADQARVALANWAAHQRQRRERDVLAARRAKLKREQGARPKPEPPDGYLPVAGDEDRRRSAVGELFLECVKLDDLLRSFRGDTVACPTCGTAVDNLAGVLADARARLPAAQAAHREADRRLDADVDYEEDLKVWTTWREGFRQRVEQLKQDAASLAEEQAAPAQSEGELRAIVADFAALRDAARAASDLAAASGREVAKLTGQWEAAMAQVEAAEARRKANRTSADAARAAQAALDAKARRIGERGQLVGEAKALRQQVEDDAAALKRLEAEEAAGGRIRSFVAEATAIRGVLHRDALPKVVASSYLGMIEGDLNALLERFDADFRVQSAEDLSYRAAFVDGRLVPASRLSGGQKVLLAIAFRVAVNALFAGSVGVLTLDEPTEFLDAKNIACLEVALVKLRELSDARGLQCLLVTHERRLAKLFDAVLDLN